MPSTVFISYCWDTVSEKNEAWVEYLAKKLQADNIRIILDKWDVLPGDPIAHFMQRAIADSDKVLIVCTPGYKQKCDNNRGAAGYESNIIATQILLTADHRKFITIIKEGSEQMAVPIGLQGKHHIWLNDALSFEKQYNVLLKALKLQAGEITDNINIELPSAKLNNNDFDNLSFAVLKDMDKAETGVYLNYYRELVTKNPSNHKAWFGLGICCLHYRIYSTAVNDFLKALQLVPSEAEYYYYYALSLCRGNNPSCLTAETINKVIDHIKAAIVLDDQQAKYYCFILLCIKPDVSAPGFAIDGMDAATVYSKSKACYRDRHELKRLVSFLSITDSAQLGLIFN